MNKKARKRAFAIFIVMCGMYLITVLKVQDRIGMKRVIAEQGNQSSPMDILTPGEHSARRPAAPPKPLQELDSARQFTEKAEATTKKESASPGGLTTESKGNLEPQRQSREEWSMPDLLYLPMRAAVEKLSTHTGKIRVLGSGHVVEQNPRSFERVHGEAECVLYGRTFVQ
jgi:hypothetical protein